MKLFSTVKKLFSLGTKLYKAYDNLPEEKKEKINEVAMKAVSKVIEKV